MDIVVSPYHLTTREPPAMAWLLLATRVFTLAPGPRRERGSAASTAAAMDAASRAPTYAAMMSAWEWSKPLWRAGVLQSNLDHDDASADVHAVNQRIAHDPAYLCLRTLMRAELLDDDTRYLEALARDLLKGGPDPALSLPLVAAIDRFASRHDMPVARAHPVSVAQRAEIGLGEAGAPLALPVLLQATAARLIHARQILEEPLAALRQALSVGSAESDGLQLRDVASAYHIAFESRLSDVLDGAKDDEVRAIPGVVVLTPMTLPPNAVLASSVVAVETLAGSKSARANSGEIVATDSLVAVDPADRRPILTWLVKAMGQSSRR